GSRFCNGSRQGASEVSSQMKIHSPEKSDRMPPQDLEAERALLGCMAQVQGAVDEISDVLTAGDFFRSDHQEIARALFRMVADGKELDLMHLQDELERSGVYEQVGGWRAITEIAEGYRGTAGPRVYARKIRSCAVLRNIQQICVETIDQS